MRRQNFLMGRLYLSQGINQKIADDVGFVVFIGDSLYRHSQGDWGDLSAEDKRKNDYSLTKHLRLLSAYIYKKDNTKIWIITEADRSATTVLLPDEY